MKKLLKWIDNQRGLTLIELLAVVVVLGILAAIAVPAIQGTIDKQRINADEATEKVIKAASLRYLYDHYVEGPPSTAPANGEVLQFLSGVNYSVDISKLKEKGYLASEFNLTKQSENEKYELVLVEYEDGIGWKINSVTVEAP